jgi:tRNA (guanine-N7-)-methyltransferase
MKRPRPYDDAPRLPEGDEVDVRTLVRGERLELEIGPGRGGFLFERAAAAPDVGLLGLEVRRKWAAIVDSRLARAGLAPRARVLAEDAKLALPRLRPSGAFTVAYLHFPDPWWKKRHQKRLVMGETFLEQIARLLAPGGELFVQTDVAERAEQYEAQIVASGLFVPAGDAEGAARMADNPYGARSPRERRAIADGLPVERLRFRRAPVDPLELEARRFAEAAHRAQSYGDAPYVTHLRAVRAVLADFGYAGPLAIAAWLHDTVEDTRVTRDEIAARFGENVAKLVWAVTGVGETRAEKNASAYAKIAVHPPAAVLKLADRIANVEASRTVPKKLEMYRSEWSSFHAHLGALGDERMWARLRTALGV